MWNSASFRSTHFLFPTDASINTFRSKTWYCALKCHVVLVASESLQALWSAKRRLRTKICQFSIWIRSPKNRWFLQLRLQLIKFYLWKIIRRNWQKPKSASCNVFSKKKRFSIEKPPLGYWNQLIFHNAFPLQVIWYFCLVTSLALETDRRIILKATVFWKNGCNENAGISSKFLWLLWSYFFIRSDQKKMSQRCCALVQRFVWIFFGSFAPWPLGQHSEANLYRIFSLFTRNRFSDYFKITAICHSETIFR